jgi:hypothetical protein
MAKLRWLRLFCQHEAERDDVLVEVETGRGETFEFAFVAPRPGIAELPPLTRFASDAGSPPRLQARDDLQALIGLAAERLGLPPAPPLPDPPTTT